MAALLAYVSRLVSFRWPHMEANAHTIMCQLFVYVKILLSCGRFHQELVNIVCELTHVCCVGAGSSDYI